MRSAHWLVCVAALGVALGSVNHTLRADEDAQKRALRLIKEVGGTATHRDDATVGAVNLSGATLTDDLLKSLAVFPELAALDLSRANGLTGKRQSFVANLTELRVLNLSHNPDVAAGSLFQLGELKNLHALDVSHCPSVGDHALETLVEVAPQLYVLDISGCKKVTAKGLLHLRELKKLEALNAADCALTDAELKEISAIAGLTHLCVANNSRLTAAGLKALAAIHDLESLDVSGCSAVTSTALKSLSTLSKLHTLNLSGCSGITDEGLKSLVGMKQLESVDLRGCRNITTNGVKVLTDAKPKLKLDR